MASSRLIIVNADDFGMSSSVNQAVFLAFRNNWITRASIMANMPGFEEACEMARRHGWTSRIGLHLNLSEGRPLSSHVASCARFCDEAGRFRLKQRIFQLSVDERGAVQEEFQAQIDALSARRIQPSHLDSHNHYHTEWPIGTIAIRIAERNRIRSIRLTRNSGSGIDPVKRLYKTLFNARLRRRDLAAVRYFGSIDDVSGVLASCMVPVEVMIHPRVRADGLVTDMDGTEELSLLLERAGLLGGPRGQSGSSSMCVLTQSSGI
jgi:predicted glycoside hydrolase/deacetylase ChbG (UPF0249 family)